MLSDKLQGTPYGQSLVRQRCTLIYMPCQQCSPEHTVVTITCELLVFFHNLPKESNASLMVVWRDYSQCHHVLSLLYCSLGQACMQDSHHCTPQYQLPGCHQCKAQSIQSLPTWLIVLPEDTWMVILCALSSFA